MARKTVKLRANADRTLTVRVGRHIEHVGLDGKDRGQVYDAVRYAAITQGVNLAAPDLTELLMLALRETVERTA